MGHSYKKFLRITAQKEIVARSRPDGKEIKKDLIGKSHNKKKLTEARFGSGSNTGQERQGQSGDKRQVSY